MPPSGPGGRTGPRRGGQGRHRLLEHQPPSSSGCWRRWPPAWHRTGRGGDGPPRARQRGVRGAAKFWTGTVCRHRRSPSPTSTATPTPVCTPSWPRPGAYLGYDGFARTQRWPDSVIIDCLRVAAERRRRGADPARRRRRPPDPLPGATAACPGLAYLGERVLPRLERETSAELVHAVLVTNPARWLSGTRTRTRTMKAIQTSTTPVPPVILTPRPDEAAGWSGSNGRYEKRLARSRGALPRRRRRTGPCSTADDGRTRVLGGEQPHRGRSGWADHRDQRAGAGHGSGRSTR